MKVIYLLVGLLVGGLLGFILTKRFYKNTSEASAGIPERGGPDSLTNASNWNWPDSLDAVQIAPQSHKIVYEDSAVRILQVVLEPGKAEPVHTHKWKSIMWFAQGTPMTYYKYGMKDVGYSLQDSFQIAQMPPGFINRGEAVEAEEPHAVKNVGNKQGVAYRVEFKKDSKR